MRKVILCILTVCKLSIIFSSGIKEGVIYEVQENYLEFNNDIELPNFVTAMSYNYSLGDYEQGKWHTYSIKEHTNNIGSGKVVIENIADLKPGKTTYQEVIKYFGLPNTVLLVEDGNYIHLNISYDDVTLYFGVNSETIIEIRFHDTTSYKFENKITVGSKLNYVLKNYPVTYIVEYEGINWGKRDVLFKNINKTDGYNYVNYKSQKLRLFFENDKVSALYLY